MGTTPDERDSPVGYAAALPDMPALIGRLEQALDRAHGEWALRGKATQALKFQIWRLAFELGVPGLYPLANGLPKEAGRVAEDALAARSAHLWLGEEQSPFREFQYDVAWAQFGGEYTEYASDLQTARHVPPFTRLVLALESELNPSWPRWHLLTDLHRLLCARADIRVMVWNRSVIGDGWELIESRLRAAESGAEGWWLLAGWSTDGFECRSYRGGERQPADGR
ncbi:MAG: hypothetical protein OXC94_04600 [Chloroflexi bacterium]|nr:hypothetical protein [Chloroflexota bacterium]